jgi:hypothetical protein
MSDLPSITISDPALIAQLMVSDVVHIKDTSGHVLGLFTSDGLGKLPPGVKSPFTDEEMVECCKRPKTGRPLTDILRDLEARQ